MSTHRHFGQPPRNIPILDGDPRFNQNGARVKAHPRTGLPLAMVPKADLVTDEDFGRLLLQSAIPDLRGDSTRRAVAPLLPREARRVVKFFNRVLILAMIAFALAFAATAVAIGLFDLAHPDQERPATLGKSDRLMEAAR